LQQAILLKDNNAFEDGGSRQSLMEVRGDTRQEQIIPAGRLSLFTEELLRNWWQ
jgi:hypothetical protein